MFKMHSSETIEQMFARFTIITNDLNALGKLYNSIELVKEFVQSLSKQSGGNLGSKRSFKAFS